MMYEEDEWLHCPYMEGPFETGCFTSAGNELVLFMDTTRAFAEARDTIFEKVFKKAGDNADLFDKDPAAWPLKNARGKFIVSPEDKKRGYKPWKWAVVGGGVWVPTLTADCLYPKVLYLIRYAVKAWEKDTGLKFEQEAHFKDDVCGYMMRSFERWMNETKVQKVA